MYIIYMYIVILQEARIPYYVSPYNFTSQQFRNCDCHLSLALQHTHQYKYRHGSERNYRRLFGGPWNVAALSCQRRKPKREPRVAEYPGQSSAAQRLPLFLSPFSLITVDLPLSYLVFPGSCQDGPGLSVCTAESVVTGKAGWTARLGFSECRREV